MQKNKLLQHLIVLIILLVATSYFSYKSFVPEKIEQNIEIIDENKNDIKDEEIKEENIYLVEKNSKQIISAIENTTSQNENITVENPSIEKTIEDLPYLATISIEGKKYEVIFAEENIVLKDLLDKLQTESDFSYSGVNYSGLGYFVNEINGLKNSNKYWVYYLNGVSAKAGISIQKINSGDNIEWKYENSTF
ncbi:MAG: hypothetical protein ACD_18C00150G0001 [uncultured bacterium]|nr:MAG: hypothetical protein ACD_18C00150G0001 [uncultured bacterium]